MSEPTDAERAAYLKGKADGYKEATKEIRELLERMNK